MLTCAVCMKYIVHITLELTGAHQKLSSTGVFCSTPQQNLSRDEFRLSLEHIIMEVLPSRQHKLRLFLALQDLS